jgi:hypothetical protein
MNFMRNYILPVFATLCLVSCIEPITLTPDIEGTITAFEVEGQTREAAIDLSTHTIRVEVEADIDLAAVSVTRIELVETATCDIVAGSIINLSSPLSVTVTTVAYYPWTISATRAPVPNAVIPNGDFEIANDNGTGTGKIGWYFYSDFEGMTDKFWDNGNGGTASAPFVGKSVTTSVEGRTGKGVEMRSAFMGLAGIGAFAAGNLYAGDFGAAVMDFSNPSGTVHFGQPFNQRPKALSVWYKASAGVVNYATKPGAPLVKGDLDRYQIFIALVDGADYDPTAAGADGGSHWHTVDTADLAGTVIDYATDSRVIGYGSFQSSDNVSDWTHQTIEVSYRFDRTPTHIVVVASASMYGDYFTGSTDSWMMVDDFELVYE